MLEEAGPRVSRATVYRTLDVLNRGGFVEGLETGNGGIVYEHVLGQEAPRSPDLPRLRPHRGVPQRRHRGTAAQGGGEQGV
ncbi:MAG: transcriptional repressor [Planctomycetota bacterium]